MNIISAFNFLITVPHSFLSFHDDEWKNHNFNLDVLNYRHNCNAATRVIIRSTVHSYVW